MVFIFPFSGWRLYTEHCHNQKPFVGLGNQTCYLANSQNVRQRQLHQHVLCRNGSTSETTLLGVSGQHLCFCASVCCLNNGIFTRMSSCRVLPYSLLYSFRIFFRSTSERLTMILVRVSLLVPKPYRIGEITFVC